GSGVDFDVQGCRAPGTDEIAVRFVGLMKDDGAASAFTRQPSLLFHVVSAQYVGEECGRVLVLEELRAGSIRSLVCVQSFATDRSANVPRIEFLLHCRLPGNVLVDNV